MFSIYSIISVCCIRILVNIVLLQFLYRLVMLPITLPYICWCHNLFICLGDLQFYLHSETYCLFFHMYYFVDFGDKRIRTRANKYDYITGVYSYHVFILMDVLKYSSLSQSVKVSKFLSTNMKPSFCQSCRENCLCGDCVYLLLHFHPLLVKRTAQLGFCLYSFGLIFYSPQSVCY